MSGKGGDASLRCHSGAHCSFVDYICPDDDTVADLLDSVPDAASLPAHCRLISDNLAGSTTISFSRVPNVSDDNRLVWSISRDASAQDILVSLIEVYGLEPDEPIHYVMESITSSRHRKGN